VLEGILLPPLRREFLLLFIEVRLEFYGTKADAAETDRRTGGMTLERDGRVGCGGWSAALLGGRAAAAARGDGSLLPTLLLLRRWADRLDCE